MNQLTLSEIILEQASKCVVCGLCLPECPTYNESRREAQSPRGRIALAKALAEESIPASNTLRASLAGCLLCRACEQACPSKVGFREMMLATQLLIEGSISPKTEFQIVVKIIIQLARMPKLFTLLVTIYKQSGLRWALRKSRIIKVLRLEYVDDLLPDIKTPMNYQRFSSKTGKTEFRIGLFTGCISQSLDNQTINSAHRVFNAMGIELIEPDRPLCCGGLNKSGTHNNGENNIRSAFPADVKTIVSCISGCTAELSENSSGKINLADVSAFLIQQDFQNIQFRPYSGIIAVHEPCSMRYPLAAQESVYSLLKKIPGARVLPLPENNRCCGGAGDYLFRQPAMAKKLRDNKIRAINMLQPVVPDIIVTSNLGCALNLQAGLRDQNKQFGNKKIEVLHPVTLLSRHLKSNNN